MGRYLLRRFTALLITLVAISIIIFVMSEVMPIDPARSILGQYATEANVQALRDQMGLDKPLVERYVTWLTNFLHGDMGESFQLGAEIRPILLLRFKNSIILALCGMLVLVPLSLVLGVIAGLMEGRPPDWGISSLALLLTSLPEFATGLILVIIFAWQLKWLPGNSLLVYGGGDPLREPLKLVLPALTVALSSTGHVIRLTRVSVAKVMGSPYIRTAILKGLPMRTVVFRHALRNALLAPLTVLTTQFGYMMGGLVVIENLFTYPGLGRLFASAASFNDIPVIEASALLGVTLAVFSQLLADILYGFLNPRIRYS